MIMDMAAAAADLEDMVRLIDQRKENCIRTPLITKLVRF